MAAIDTVFIANESFQLLQNSTGEQISFFERHFSDITSLIEVILIGLYVYYTIKTFRELKKQTDLQLKAYLNTENLLLSDKELKGNDIKLDTLDMTFSKDWKQTMEKAFPELTGSDIFDGGYYTLELTNYGNTEIKSFEFESTIKIDNSPDSVTNKKLVPSETKTFKTSFNHILKKGESIKIPLFSTASYPIFNIVTIGKYKDVRGESYQIETLKYENENNHLK